MSARQQIDSKRVRAVYGEELEAARLELLLLGSYTGDAVRAALDACSGIEGAAGHGDAKKAIAIDLRRQMERRCMDLIWRQQPVAGDLREVTAMLEISDNLDEIGYEVASITRNASQLRGWPVRSQRLHLDRMADVTHGMLLDAMEAFRKRDADLATVVIRHRDLADGLYQHSVEIVQEEMHGRSSLMRAGMSEMLVLGSLKLVAARAVDVAAHTRHLIGLTAEHVVQASSSAQASDDVSVDP